MRHLMTSNQWPDSRDVSGILSPRPSENPHWHTANHVSVPYCSSDSWSGTAALRNNTSFHFMGKHILNQVIRDLIPLGLQNSSQLILAGSSAGGTGVMVNLDPIQHLLHAELGLKHIAVRGISDSGWFLDRTPYSPNTLPAVDAIKKGHALWQGSLPKRCVDLYPQEPWRCYFGYRLYPTIRAPLFVFQWLFDEAQMTADNVGTPVTPQQWDYIHSMGRALRASFANVSAVFAPSCVSHSVLTKKDWLQVTVADVTVANALRCWELATMKRPFRNHSKLANVTPRGLAVRQLVRSATQDETIEGGGGARRRRPSDGGPRRRRRKKNREGHHDDRNYRDRNIFNNDHSFNQRPRKQHKTPNQRKTMSNSHRMSNYHYSQTNNNRRKHGNRRRGNVVHNCSNEEEIQYNQRPEPNTRRNQLKCDSRHKGRRHNRSRKEDKRHRNVNATLVPNIISIVGEDKSGYGRSRNEELDGLEKPIRPQRSLLRGPKTVNPGCEHRHIEPCSWPQCNPSCPRLLNPNTGEEVLFVDMLKSFGLEMESVAQALGVDMHTLNNMDQSELLNLLTQQIN